MSLALVFLVLTASPFTSSIQGNGVSSIGTGGSHVIQGQIYLPSGRRGEGITVKLHSLAGGELSVMSSDNGAFTFRSLAPGQYKVVVESGKDYERAEESVFIDTDAAFGQVPLATSATRAERVVFHLLPKRAGGTDATSSVVNAAALVDVPEPARKLYEKGLSAAQSGDAKKAIENLKSAVSMFPDFAAALDELGVQYLKLGQADKALESLNAAIKLTPDEFRTNLNLGIALLETKQFEASETRLMTALKRNDSSPTAHMYLGLTLMSQKRLPEAQTELEKAVVSNTEQVAKAHYYLGGIYWGNREYKRAADALETYLRLVPKAPEAEKVRATIKELRDK
jgi:Flp pilus assembly protein TadD